MGPRPAAGRVRTERALELRRLPALDDAPRQQEADGARVEPAHRERERVRRDASSHWTSSIASRSGPPSLEELQRVAHRDRERPAIDGFVEASSRSSATSSARRLGAEERGQHVVEDALEQIAEPDVGERALRLGRPRREDGRSLRARLLDARLPERRLADPRLPLEHECGGPSAPGR